MRQKEPVHPLPTPTAWDLQHLASCDGSVRLRRLVELAIVRKVAADLIAAGYLITVDDGEDEPVKNSTDVDAIIDAAFAVDEAYLRVAPNPANESRAAVRNRSGFVRLIFGNTGWDAVSDYSVNLEEALKPSSDYADLMCQWF
jgi:hypothetical protein